MAQHPHFHGPEETRQGAVHLKRRLSLYCCACRLTRLCFALLCSALLCRPPSTLYARCPAPFLLFILCLRLPTLNTRTAPCATASACCTPCPASATRGYAPLPQVVGNASCHCANLPRLVALTTPKLTQASGSRPGRRRLSRIVDIGPAVAPGLATTLLSLARIIPQWNHTTPLSAGPGTHG